MVLYAIIGATGFILPYAPPLAHLTPNFAANKTHLTHTSWTNKRFVEMDGSKNKE